MTTDGARHVAYADLVGGLLDARVDPATEHFDAELSAALAAGTVTAEAARTLRYWQRASVRGLVEHARNVLPPALSALEAAREESKETVAAEQRSWTAATGGTARDLAEQAKQRDPIDQADPSDATDPTVSNDALDETDETAPSVTPSVQTSINLTDHRRSRLIVAGLMSSLAPADDDA
jgi:hypothetical protein